MNDGSLDVNDDPPLKEPHLIDITHITEVAQWIAAAAASGLIGKAAVDVLQSFRNRFGRREVTKLRTLVEKEIQERIKTSPDGTVEHETITRVRTFFRDYE